MAKLVPHLLGMFAVSAVVGIGALIGSPSASVAASVPCGARPLSIRAFMDTPNSLDAIPLAEAPNAKVNVGQRSTLSAFWGDEFGGAITGSEPVVPARWRWQIDGPTIKDYFELVGIVWAPSAPSPPEFQTLPLMPSDLTRASVSFYWKPTPQQIYPNPGDAVEHTVTLTATMSDNTACTVTARFAVERNSDDPAQQPEDFYTSSHRAPAETNPAKGAVVDEHMLWHFREGLGRFGQPDFVFWMRFLPWHRAFLHRFQDWRAEFGYPPVENWDPATELPAGPVYEHPAAQRNPIYDRIAGNTPTWLSLTGGLDVLVPGLPPRISDFQDLTFFSGVFEATFHGLPHCLIGPGVDDFFAGTGVGFGSMCAASSPKDPMFWRWHGFVDLLYSNYCATQPAAACAGDLFPQGGTDLWLAENDADLASGGQEPATGPVGAAIEVWNRRTPATCTPFWPRDGEVRTCGPMTHENPVADTVNYLYIILHNDRPGAIAAPYAEVAVWEGEAAGAEAHLVNLPIPDPLASPGALHLSSHAVVLGLPAGANTAVGPILWRPSAVGARQLVVQVSSPKEIGPLDGTAAVALSGIDTVALSSNNVVVKDVTVDPNGIIVANSLALGTLGPQPCVPLDAEKLTLTSDGHSGTVLKAGNIDFGRLGSAQDGKSTLALAQALHEVCRFQSTQGASFTFLR